MGFFTSAVSVLQTLVIALGAGLCIWGGINLLEGYGNDNPGAKSQCQQENNCRTPKNEIDSQQTNAYVLPIMYDEKNLKLI